MKTFNYIISFICLSLFLSGCATFTKMRYSNGFKSNLEFSLRNREEKEEVFKASRALKKQGIQRPAKMIYPVSDTAIKAEPFSYTFSENIRQHISEKNNISSEINKVTHSESIVMAKNDRARKEPMVRWGTWLYLSGMAGVFYPPAIILSILGLTLIIFGLRRIKNSEIPFRGKEKAIIVIVFTILSIPLMIFNFAMALFIAALIFIVWISFLFILLILWLKWQEIRPYVN